MTTIAQQLDNVLAFAEKATPGEWAATVGGHVKKVGGAVIVDPNRMRGETMHANADFIAALANLIRQHGPAIRAAVGGEAVPVAWWDGDDRVINLAAKEAGARSGGATASATSAYSIPLYASPPATVDVGALRELELLRDAFKQWRAFGGIETGLCDELAALIDGAGNG